MCLYRIKLWEQRYENNRTRELKRLDWLPLPNRHDGENYARLMLRPDAAEIFTAWILLLQVASRCETRGTLARDDGSPLDAESLAIRTRVSQKLFVKALPVLVQMGWLESIEAASPLIPHDPASGCEIPASGCGEVAARCLEGKEGNGKKEGKVRTSAKPPRAASPANGDDFIAALKSNPAYQTIDIDRELSKMDAWLQTPKGRGRKKSHQFILNWLNKIDVPVTTTAIRSARNGSHGQSPTPEWTPLVREIRTLLSAKDEDTELLKKLGEALPKAGWEQLDKTTEWNRLNKIVKGQS